MADATLTRYELSLGDYDATTGWPAPSYSSTSIVGSIQPQGAAVLGLPCGGVARYPHTLFTPDVIADGDEVQDAFGDYYTVKSHVKHSWLNQFSHYQCELEKRSPYAQPPTTSGTWHVDSDSLKTDSRYCQKKVLDDNLASVYKDDGTTVATDVTMFADIPYYLPLTQLFLTKGVDCIYSIDKREGEALRNDKYFGFQPYAFIETVPITCWAVNKSGLTATNVVEQMEQAIRDVCTDHPLGSLRSIERTNSGWEDIGGGLKAWYTTVEIRYKRANDDYSATYPTLTWGPSGAPTGTYTFPNCINIQPNGDIPNIRLPAVNRMGNVPQRLGDSDMVITFTCDLDVDAPNKAWKRAQGGAATDQIPEQVLWDIKHNGGLTQAYQTLTLGASGPTFNVTLENYKTYTQGGTRYLQFTVKEYRATSATGTYSARWGFS